MLATINPSRPAATSPAIARAVRIARGRHVYTAPAQPAPSFAALAASFALHAGGAA